MIVILTSMNFIHIGEKWKNEKAIYLFYYFTIFKHYSQ